MILVRVDGGLGNQLFLYATGRAYSLRNNTELLLETSLFDFNESHAEHVKYSLPVYNIFTSPPPDNFMQSLNENKFHVINSPYWNIFHPEILTLTDDLIISGCFLFPIYFEDYADQIRSELTLKDPLSPESQIWAEKILSDPCPVSIHVRRGDYLSQANIDVFLHLPKSYYYKCVNILRKNFSNVSLYIFSDDIPWCRKNFKFDVPTYFVDCNDELHGYEDLELMKLCRHHIIANSTFSWWAAWLDDKVGSIVFAPRRIGKIYYQMYEFMHIPFNWIIFDEVDD